MIQRSNTKASCNSWLQSQPAGDISGRGDASTLACAASDRLKLAAKQHREKKPETAGVYYGEKGQLEELILEFARPGRVDALVTRNHYGCLVLNAGHALFIDVDMLQPSPEPIANGRCGERLTGIWRRTFDDLRTVLAGERRESFRIYRTAAGFRILATAHECEPGSAWSIRLMNAVGADADFIRLCRTQNCFRARLTPKPWRCGVAQPPTLFPRRSTEDQCRFKEWLANYELACLERSTCRHLDDIGSADPCAPIEQIIRFHDRATRAFEPLTLA